MISAARFKRFVRRLQLRNVTHFLTYEYERENGLLAHDNAANTIEGTEAIVIDGVVSKIAAYRFPQDGEERPERVSTLFAIPRAAVTVFYSREEVYGDPLR